MFGPGSFREVKCDGKTAGFSFTTKIQYYRGSPLSIIRNIEVEVDGVKYPREAIRFTVNDETFTLEEMRTVISNRWHFGQSATVTVLVDGGLKKGKHHIKCTQTIHPSYMPFPVVTPAETDFELN
jgi:hypothetical protein